MMSLLGCLVITEGYIVAYLLPPIYRKKVTLSLGNPDVAVGVFTLIGTLIGALIAGGFSFLVTNRTLRHQETVWQRETRLRELERQRAEIEQLITDLGNMDLRPDGSLTLVAGASPAARSAFYRLLTWQVRLAKSHEQSLSKSELANVLTQLESERRHVAEQINDLIAEPER